MKGLALASCFVASGIVAAQSLQHELVQENRNRAGFYTAKIAYPEFKPSNALSRFATAEFQRHLRRGLLQFIQENRSIPKPTHPYAFEATTTVAFASSQVISGRQPTYFYTGGAHPNTVWPAMTFGWVKGQPKRITLEDLLKDGASATWVDDLILTKLRERQASWILDGSVTTLSGAQRNNFTADARGMAWWFSPYEMGPYVQGMFVIDLPWSALRPYLNPNSPLRSLHTRPAK